MSRKASKSITQSDITRFIKAILESGHIVTRLRYDPFNGLQADIDKSRAASEDDWDIAVS